VTFGTVTIIMRTHEGQRFHAGNLLLRVRRTYVYLYIVHVKQVKNHHSEKLTPCRAVNVAVSRTTSGSDLQLDSYI
jgi:hypothetical protein